MRTVVALAAVLTVAGCTNPPIDQYVRRVPPMVSQSVDECAPTYDNAPCVVSTEVHIQEGYYIYRLSDGTDTLVAPCLMLDSPMCIWDTKLRGVVIGQHRFIVNGPQWKTGATP